MRGSEIGPQFAAEMASNVYLVNGFDGRDLFKLKYKNVLDIGEQSMVSGTTGGLVV